MWSSRRPHDRRASEDPSRGVAVPLEPEHEHPRDRLHDPDVRRRLHAGLAAVLRGVWANEVEVLLVLLLIVLTIIFGFGFYLDKFLRFWSAQTTVATVRNQFL